MGEAMGPVWLKVEIQRTKSVFKFAHDTGLIDHAVRFGPLFRPPSNRVIKEARHDKGPRMFEATEIRQMLDAARPQLRAMILLGINCGFGNNDCASLPKSALDLDGGWLDFPRPKTAVERPCPLWPSTVSALREAVTVRPSPKKPLTHHGNRWVRMSGDSWPDSITFAMRQLLVQLNLKRRA